VLVMVTSALSTVGMGSGTASFTVTYQMEDGGPDVTKQIEIEGVRCGEDEGGLSFRDSSAGPDDPEFSASTFESPSTGESFGFFTLRLGEDLVFHSTEVFAADASDFTLDGHPRIRGHRIGRSVGRRRPDRDRGGVRDLLSALVGTDHVPRVYQRSSSGSGSSNASATVGMLSRSPARAPGPRSGAASVSSMSRSGAIR